MGFDAILHHYVGVVLGPPSAFTGGAGNHPASASLPYPHTYVCRHVTSNGNNMSGCVVLFMTAEDEQEFDRFLAFAKNDEDEPTEWVGVLKRLP